MFDVAVVTPVFNTEEYLHRCVESVLQQEGVSLQLYLVDDGSTDNSASICRHYQHADPRVVVISKRNEGQGIARNQGIRLADARYIYFVDSDDSLGEGTLQKLFSAAEKHHLDICSPKVPEHYFSDPLELIPCLPCKSQFIRMDRIRKAEILQPDIRSGQDGVFSHLVLTQCQRIGMVDDAEFNYTHARPGSTFAAHLKRHDLVPGLLKQHYEAIRNFYDRLDLWARNGTRLLSFVSRESLRNRLDPHIAHLDRAEKQACFAVLKPMIQRAMKHVDPTLLPLIDPAVLAIHRQPIEKLVECYESEFSGSKHVATHPGTKNFTVGTCTIVKYADDRYQPKTPGKAQPEVSSHPAGRMVTRGEREIQSQIGALNRKLDLAINTVNNATISALSAVRSPAPDLTEGREDIVVSLTTLPGRLPIVHHAIESVFSQSILPGKIVLWVTDRIAEDQVTPALRALCDRGLEIRRVNDVGPHTKLMYALEAFPDKSIVTVDDDIVYPANMLQTLLVQHERNPGMVICNWARELSFDEEGRVQGVRAGRLLTPPTLEREIEQAQRFEGAPNLLAFPYGTSGVLYPPGALSERVFEVDTFRELCPKEDDIWFKAMSLLNRTPVVVTNFGINPNHHCITGSQFVALRHDNHGLEENARQMQNVFENLGLYDVLGRVPSSTS